MSDEKEAQDIFDETMREIANEAAGVTEPQDSGGCPGPDTPADPVGDPGPIVIRGDSGYTSKDDFGKKTTYVPSDGHGVWEILKDARDLCSAKSELDSEQIEIGVTFVYPFVSKTVYAHILKPNRLLKMYSGLKLLIEISGTAWDLMTADERMALLHHELEHVDFREKRNGDLELRLIDHNVKDFYTILDKYGLAYIRSGLNEE